MSWHEEQGRNDPSSSFFSSCSTSETSTATTATRGKEGNVVINSLFFSSPKSFTVEEKAEVLFLLLLSRPESRHLLGTSLDEERDGLQCLLYYVGTRVRALGEKEDNLIKYFTGKKEICATKIKKILGTYLVVLITLVFASLVPFNILKC